MEKLKSIRCFFAALIHDVAHPGVSNEKLVNEKAPIVSLYGNRSAIEQQSIDIAFSLLLEARFSKLRKTIYTEHSEMLLFHQLVFRSVLATDIDDWGLLNVRNARWKTVFESQRQPCSLNDPETAGSKAALVIDVLMQASDVAHTMQHWHLYRKWNDRLFFERYHAFLEGRADVNPAQRWYDEQAIHFTSHVIPLAKKLHDSGVFGVSSTEYLDCATKNLSEWQIRGKEIVMDLEDQARVLNASKKRA